MPVRYVSADEPTLRGTDWISQQWEAARLEADEQSGRRARARRSAEDPGVVGDGQATVGRGHAHERPLKVVLLGSAPLLVQQGLTESLAGRFEILRLPHWSFAEMRDAFGFTLDQYLYFGGYPGAAPLIRDRSRWSRYIRDSLIETTIARDVLLLTRVDKPALLRRLFELAAAIRARSSRTRRCSASSRTRATRRRWRTTSTCWPAREWSAAFRSTRATRCAAGSSPKLQVLNTALMTVTSAQPTKRRMSDREFRGRLVESAVGAHLANAAAVGDARSSTGGSAARKSTSSCAVRG